MRHLKLVCQLTMMLAFLAFALSVEPYLLAQSDDPAPGAESQGTTEAAPSGDAESGEALPASPEMGWVHSMLIGFGKKWVQGGITMYVLLFVAIVGVIAAIDRFIALQRARVAPRGLADAANKAWNTGDPTKAMQLVEYQSNSLARVIAFLVEHRNAPYEQLERAAEDVAMREFEVHSSRNNILAAVATIAPLLGLMGTVFGLMGAFASIGAIGTMDDPTVLAKDIGKAMVTTAAGLVIAVPALGLYHFFRSRTGQLAAILGEETSNLMHAWFLGKREASA